MIHFRVKPLERQRFSGIYARPRESVPIQPGSAHAGMVAPLALVTQLAPVSEGLMAATSNERVAGAGAGRTCDSPRVDPLGMESATVSSTTAESRSPDGPLRTFRLKPPDCKE